MNPNSFISEDAATGGFARINLGNGALGSVGANTGDADGVYFLPTFGSPNPTLTGTPIDIFPRETNFQVGNIGFNALGLTGSGVETTAITSIDLSQFWTADPARTATTAGTPPSVISDISDHGLGLWFFNGRGSIGFGALDANDTLTFTNGMLTSIDLELSTTFTIEAFGPPTTWNGLFSINGNQLSYQINDTQLAGGFLSSTLVADLTGTVNSVGNYSITAVPEPSSLALLGLAGAGFAYRRRQRDRKIQATKAETK